MCGNRTFQTRPPRGKGRQAADYEALEVSTVVHSVCARGARDARVALLHLWPVSTVKVSSFHVAAWMQCGKDVDIVLSTPERKRRCALQLSVCTAQRNANATHLFQLHGKAPQLVV